MTELEQKLLAENERLRCEVDELKRKLEANIAPRVEYVDEKTRRFRGELYKKQKANGYYVQNRFLHVDVYKFYHGLSEIPKNSIVHHDGKDEDGNYDKEKNDIEHLVLMTRAEHTALHNPTISRFEYFTCRICGTVFRGRKSRGNHYCSKKCRLAVQKEIRDYGKYNETRIFAHCGKEYTVQKYKNQKYCSRRCSSLAQWERCRRERSDIGKAD
ncbi:MAG: hypothetical protein IJ685_10000 [Selenomonadaceae bacterium]|nr:hypothetical protein [Selenomonadaceae bacterium]